MVMEVRTRTEGTSEEVQLIRADVSGTLAPNPVVSEEFTDTRTEFYVVWEPLSDSRDATRELEEQFEFLAQQWAVETAHLSSITQMVMHPAYQKIVGKGRGVVSLILQRLQKQPEHWFWALRTITDEWPVPSEAEGNIQKMADAWVDWGRAKGYLA